MCMGLRLWIRDAAPQSAFITPLPTSEYSYSQSTSNALSILAAHSTFVALAV